MILYIWKHMRYYSDVYLSGLIYSIFFKLSFHQHLDILEAIHCSFGIVHADLECDTNLSSCHGEAHAWIQRVHPLKITLSETKREITHPEINGWKIQGQAVNFMEENGWNLNKWWLKPRWHHLLWRESWLPIPALGLVYAMAVFTDCSWKQM